MLAAGIEQGRRKMICPHCNTGVRFEISGSSEVYVEDQDANRGYDVAQGFCPECKGFIVVLRRGRFWAHYEGDSGSLEMTEIRSSTVIFPPNAIQRPLPAEVPANYSRDFQEASAVLSISPRASAALSRRVLQEILHTELQIKAGSLAREIYQFISRAGVPTQLAEAVDAIRNLGNFAAHPLKDTQTGSLIEVEAGEAEWLLDVLEALFDFVFVQPSRLDKRKTQLNAKLAAAGKPPMK
jgi:hypothetical protein